MYEWSYIKRLRWYVDIGKKFLYMFFYGLLGIGKMLMILVLVKEFYGFEMMKLWVFELNVFDECGIFIVWEKVKNFVCM